MKERITHNLGMKILSLCVAAIVWVIVINIDDPNISKTFQNISVTILNDNVVESKDLVYEPIDGSTVDITVYGKKSLVDNITQSDLKVTADLSQLSKWNAVPIDDPICIKYPGLQCSLGKTKTLKVKLEEKDTQSFSPVIKQIGTVKDGYFVGETYATPNIIQVTGAKSQIAKIAEVRLYIDVSNADKDIERIEAVPKAFGSDNRELDSTKLRFSQEKVFISAQVLKTKVVPVKVVIKGEPAYGYQYTNYDYEPKNITIAGEENILSGVSSIEIPISIDKASGDWEETADVAEYLPDKVKVTDSSRTVSVQIKIEKQIEKEITFENSDIQVKNLPQKMIFQYGIDSESFSVKIMGLQNKINSISITDLKPYIDLNKMKLGKNRIDIQFEPPEGVEIRTTPIADIILQRNEEEEIDNIPKNTPDADNNIPKNGNTITDPEYEKVEENTDAPEEEGEMQPSEKPDDEEQDKTDENKSTEDTNEEEEQIP